MTEQELIGLANQQIKLLAEIMRLQNWGFTIKVVSALDLEESGSWAEMWSNSASYVAIIKLNQARWLYKVDWCEDEAKALRQTLAHELAHLYHRISRTFTDERYREEWMCEMIADAVVHAMVHEEAGDTKCN